MRITAYTFLCKYNHETVRAAQTEDTPCSRCAETAYFVSSEDVDYAFGNLLGD